MNYNYVSDINLSRFFKISLELFRTVKNKEEEKLVKKIQKIFQSEAYASEILHKLIEIEKDRCIRDSQFQ